jgi:hypothetical protein
MNSEKLNRWLSLVSNMAVIAGIIFLAIEIRQNTQQLEIQSYQSWVAANMEINSATANLEMAEITALGHPDSRNLSQETYVAYAMQHMSMFQMAQSTHYLYLQGSIDEELWRTEMARAGVILSFPGVRQWWEAGGKTQLTPSFVAFIESLEVDAKAWYWDEERGFTSDNTFENSDSEKP